MMWTYYLAQYPSGKGKDESLNELQLTDEQLEELAEAGLVRWITNNFHTILGEYKMLETKKELKKIQRQNKIINIARMTKETEEELKRLKGKS